MPVIKRLPPHVIAQIAAGQVVERPVSIVKELLENALDAQAKNILIRVTDGGKQKITVTDDGIGMDAADLLLAVEPHATSKIQTVEDLRATSSLGFRGEALHSMAQVSRLSIQSRTKKAARGSQLVVESGKIISQAPIGMSVGTSITIEKLFESVPARKKFLRSTKTEFQLILESITQLAVSFPAIGFQLYHNDQLIFDLLPQHTTEKRIAAILGKNFSKYFLPFKLEVSDYKLSGFIGTPQAATTVSQSQFLLVNNRPVVSKKITTVIKRSFKTLLPPAVQPPYILFIKLDPENIDVNTHPQKKEVRFTEEELLLEVVANLVQQTLEKANLLFTFAELDALTLNDSKMDVGTAQILRDATEAWNVKEYFEAEPVLQISNLYLLAQTKQGVILIDQHAAHERILYEQFLQAFQSEQAVTFTLPKKVKVSFPVLESELLEENRDVFEKLGFAFIRSSATSFSFTQVPKILQTRRIEEFLLEVIQDIKNEVTVTELDLQSHKTIAYLACRTAIKAGEVLTQQERKNILRKLLATTSKYTCPHGRPVLIHLSATDLAKMFYRIPSFRNEK